MAVERLRCLLQDLEYPNITEMGKEELCEVFKATNRIEFLKWVVGKLGYTDLPKTDEALRAAIVNLIESQGFCSSEEKTKFVDSALDEQFDITSELKIIFCILEYMCARKTASLKEQEVDKLMTLSNEDMIMFCEEAVGFQTKVKLSTVMREEKKQSLFHQTTDRVYKLSESDRQRELIPKIEGGENNSLDYEQLQVALTTFTKSMKRLENPENKVKEEKTAVGELTCFKRLVDLYSKFSANAETINNFMQQDFKKDESNQSVSNQSKASTSIATLSKLVMDVLKDVKEL